MPTGIFDLVLSDRPHPAFPATCLLSQPAFQTWTKAYAAEWGAETQWMKSFRALAQVLEYS